MPVFCRGVFP